MATRTRSRVETTPQKVINKPAVLDATSAWLVSKGMERPALHTTSKLQGPEYDHFHDEVLEGEFCDHHGETVNRIFVAKPSRDRKTQVADFRKARLMFFLYFKECLLARHNVGIHSLFEMWAELRNPENYAERVEDRGYRPFIFIPDFCETRAAGIPFDGSAYVKKGVERHIRWLRAEHNVGIVLLSTVLMEDIKEEWSEFFLEDIIHNAITYAVSAEGDK